MTTALAPIPRPVRAQSRQHFILHGASWDLYELFLRDAGDQHIHITYDNGSLELMSPSNPHERWKSIIGRFIEAMADELNIPLEGSGSTTFRRKDLARGLEPDECYYIQHAEQVRHLKEIDLRRDPPPDLAIEIDITHHELDRESIYAALGVPELWQFDGSQLTAWQLAAGRYVAIERSVAFPFLHVADLNRFLALVPDLGQTAAVRQFRAWLKTQAR